MEAFDVLGDPVRRRILELLADQDRGSGAVAEIIQREFAISQGAVSQHLGVLRNAGFATSRKEGVRRIYSLEGKAFHNAQVWLERFRQHWEPKLESLATEVARGKKKKKENK